MIAIRFPVMKGSFMSDKLGYTYGSDGKYCYEGSDVLVNKLDLKSYEELNPAKAEAVAKRTEEMLEMDGLSGHYDLKHLKSFHHQLFQDIFDWAGELRTVDISEDVFCKADDIEGYAVQVFLRLENEDYLKGLSVEDLADRLAYYSYEIEKMHPFRCGNFTAMTAFLTQMCRRVGFKYDISGIPEDEIESARKALIEGDQSKLEAVYLKAVSKIPRKK